MRRVATTTQEERQHTTHMTLEKKETTYLKKKMSLNSFYNCSLNPNPK